MMHGPCSRTEPQRRSPTSGALGGNFFGLPFMKNSIEGAVLDISGSAAFSDIYVQPRDSG
jgi:hypothetical protein